METLQPGIEELLKQAEVLLAKRNFKQALPIYEVVLQTIPTRGAAWLGAGECALGLGLGDRALSLLAELKPFYDLGETERWVNLRSEALRRFGIRQEDIAFIDEWTERVGLDTKAKLLLRKAAFLAAHREREAASRALRQAWAISPKQDPSLMVSTANVAILSGEMSIASDVGKRLLHSRRSLAGIYLYLFGALFSSHPLLVRLPASLVLVGLLLLPSLRPVVLALLAFIVFGAVISWTQRLVALGSALAFLALLIGATYSLFLLAGTGTVGGILGVFLLAAFVIGAGVVLLREKAGRKRKAQRGE